MSAILTEEETVFSTRLGYAKRDARELETALLRTAQAAILAGSPAAYARVYRAIDHLRDASAELEKL